MSKVRLKLKCGKNEALDFIAAAEADGIEKARCDDEGVEIRLTKEEGGVRVVEYVFRGEVSDDEISGTFVRPDPRREDIPGPVLSSLLLLVVRKYPPLGGASTYTTFRHAIFPAFFKIFPKFFRENFSGREKAAILRGTICGLSAKESKLIPRPQGRPRGSCATD